MKLFDENIILRFALLFACVLFAAFIPGILDFTDNYLMLVPYVLAIIFLAYVSIFYRFPSALNRKKIRNDVEIPNSVETEPVRDFEKDLHEQDEIFQMMIDVSQDGFWTYSVPTGKVYWSNRVAKLLGAKGGLEDSFYALKSYIMEKDWTEFKSVLSKALAEGGNFSCTLRLSSHRANGCDQVVIAGRTQVDAENRPVRVIGFISTAMDRKAVERQNYFYVYQDALTGVYNRKFFLEKLKTDMEAASLRHDTTLAVVLLDIDSFGSINASYSMNFGDNVLRVVSERIKAFCKEEDTVARIGPDVFAVIMHDVDLSDKETGLLSTVKQLHNKVKSPIQLDGRDLFISISMAVVVNTDADCVEDILASANAVLRNLKKSVNHGSIQFVTGGIREKAMKLYSLEYEIRRAIQFQEFVLMYQPIVDIGADNSIVGFEALVRWNNSKQGVISPAEFIPLAEETGLIVPMGALILRMACEQTKKWVDMGYENIRVAVNFSARQFSMESMVDDVKKILAETHLNPRNLKLEITEYTATCEVEKAADIMRSLSNMGLQISIDDFGTGYSSLSYLKHLPVHTLKMDKSFIDHVADDEEDAAFAKMVIGIAKSLNLSLIAEGVETVEQLEFLRREGCRQIQGFYFSEPLSPEDALDYMKQHYAGDSAAAPAAEASERELAQVVRA